VRKGGDSQLGCYLPSLSVVRGKITRSGRPHSVYSRDLCPSRCGQEVARRAQNPHKSPSKWLVTCYSQYDAGWRPTRGANPSSSRHDPKRPLGVVIVAYHIVRRGRGFVNMCPEAPAERPARANDGGRSTGPAPRILASSPTCGPASAWQAEPPISRGLYPTRIPVQYPRSAFCSAAIGFAILRLRPHRGL
jgi:hypothetical protein